MNRKHIGMGIVAVATLCILTAGAYGAMVLQPFWLNPTWHGDAEVVAECGPTTALNNGPVTLTFYAMNITTVYRIYLESTSDPSIQYEGYDFYSYQRPEDIDSNYYFLQASFPITGAPPGDYKAYIVIDEYMQQDIDDGYADPLYQGDAPLIIQASDVSSGVFAAWPDQGKVDEAISVKIYGSGFDADAEVKLASDSRNDIIGITSFVNEYTLETTFDFEDEAPGTFDIVVTSPNIPESPLILPQGFSIMASVFSVADIIPNKGGDTGFCTVNVYGQNFPANPTVKLIRNLDTIVGDILSTESRRLLVQFDLASKDQGVWDLQIENSQGDIISLMEAFTIEAGKNSLITIDVIGRNQIRTLRQSQYTIYIYNKGNTDTIGTAVIHGIPDGAEWEIRYPMPPFFAQEINAKIRDTSVGKLVILPPILVYSAFISKIEMDLKVPTDQTFILHAVWE